MTDAVELTLKKWRQTSFSYDNGNDCLLSLADYLIERGYPDFGKKFRDKFHDEKSALDVLKQSGGPISIIDQTCLKPTKEPKRGDISVVEISGNFLAGLFLNDQIAFRNFGLVTLNVKFLKIKKSWEVENV